MKKIIKKFLIWYKKRKKICENPFFEEKTYVWVEDK